MKIITQEENRRRCFGEHYWYWLICENCKTRKLVYGIYFIDNNFCKCVTDDFIGDDFIGADLPYKTTTLCA